MSEPALQQTSLVLQFKHLVNAAAARAHFFVERSYFTPSVASSNLLKESLIKFRNATPVDVLEAVPLYGNGQRDVANGQRTVNARSTQRSTHGQRNGSI